MQAGSKEDILLQRHLRIKTERQSILTTLIGLNGGAIVLSATLLEKIAPMKLSVWLIISAWSLLTLSLISALGALVEMTARSARYQRYLERELDGDTPHFVARTPIKRITSTPMTRTSGILLGGEIIAGALFVLGVVFLCAFAMINLLAR
jgi:hypothetical protein